MINEKRRGRPKKTTEEKENPIAVRFSKRFLSLIRKAASDRGLPWQSFIKATLAKEIGFPDEWTKK